MINARAETVAEKPSFRNAFQKRRCLVFADGYYEWKKENGGKQPYYITGDDPERGFCLAGLWESWQDPQDQRIESCTIITTDALPSLARIHDRMPVIIQPKDFAFWLDTECSSQEKLQSILKPAADGTFQATPVSQLVNSPRHDNPQCVVPVTID